MPKIHPGTSTDHVALRKESVDRNPIAAFLLMWYQWSLSARRAWIEMQDQFLRFRPRDVALRKESVDRNLYLSSFVLASLVALRKESVDRNCRPGAYPPDRSGSLSARRAWIEIDIDDKFGGLVSVSLSARRAWIEIEAPSSAPYAELSLSARRAWIEIGIAWVQEFPELVALRKESVDRNARRLMCFLLCGVALRKESVDRNDAVQIVVVIVHVALRKESVDRNRQAVSAELRVFPSLSARRAWIEIPPVDTSSVNVSGRSPQGERG